MTPNYFVYNSLKRLILVPFLLLIIFFWVIFKKMPKLTSKDSKLFIAAAGSVNITIVIGLYIILIGLILIVVWLYGARSQNKRYLARQRQFNKILRYFNEQYFNKKGITIRSGRFGAYLVIRVWSEEDLKAIKLKRSNESKETSSQSTDEGMRCGRKSEFSKSLLIEPFDTSSNLDLDEK